MEATVKETMVSCTHRSAEGTMTFPQVVQSLMQAGVERYDADLQRSERTYYLPNGESLVVPAHRIAAAPAETFDPARVEAAIRRTQAQKTSYREFCEDLAAAGCVSYLISLVGRRAVYLGRTGESYVESFPTAS